MDKRHREELEQNDLESFLSNAGQWWEKYGMHVMLVALVVVAVYTAKTWYLTSRLRAHQDVLQNLETSTSPDSLRDVAVNAANNPQISAVAYLRGADLALAKATLPAAAPAPGSQPPATQPDQTPDLPQTPENHARLLDDASTMYQAVIQNSEAPLLLRLNAKLGLAAVNESRADWAAAGKLYQEIIDESASYELIKTKAQGNLAMLGRLALSVPFAPEPIPAKIPALSNFLHDSSPSATTKPARAYGSP